jgi:hypothetical protein
MQTPPVVPVAEAPPLTATAGEAAVTRMSFPLVGSVAREAPARV